MKAKTKKIFVLLLALAFAACLSVTVVYAANYVSYKVEKQPGDSFPGVGLFIGIYFGRMFLGAGLLIS